MTRNMTKENFAYQRPFIPRINSHETRAMTTVDIFTVTIPVGVSEVLVQARTANIHFTIDGTDPSQTSGFLLTAGNKPDVIPVVPSNMTLKFIGAAAGAVLEICYGE